MSAPHRTLNRNFLLFFQGQLISLIGSAASRTALGLWIVDTVGSATALGGLEMAASATAILVGPFGGALGDRCPRRSLLVACDAAFAFVAATLATALWLYPSLPGLAVAMLATGRIASAALNGVFNPVAWAILPDLVPTHGVAASNALFWSGADAAALAGRGLGGLLYRAIGGPLVLAVDAITFVVSALCGWCIWIPSSASSPAGARRAAPGRLFADAWDGMALLWRQPGLRVVAALNAATVFWLFPVIVLLPFYVRGGAGLATSGDWYGYLMAALGVGSLAGSAAAARVRLPPKWRKTALLAALLAPGVLSGALAAISSPPFAALALACSGACQGFSGNTLHTLVQTASPPHARARSVASYLTASAFTAPLAAGLAGVAADLATGTGLVCLVCGAGVLMSIVLAATCRELWEFVGAA